MYILVNPNGKESYNARDPISLAYEILMKREMGLEGRKTTTNSGGQLGAEPEIDSFTGLVKQKGKSGEVARAEAEKKFGAEPNQGHLDILTGEGWILKNEAEASLNGLGMWIGRDTNEVKYSR